MLASEVIEALQRIVVSQGDMEVRVYPYSDPARLPTTSVKVVQDDGTVCVTFEV